MLNPSDFRPNTSDDVAEGLWQEREELRLAMESFSWALRDSAKRSRASRRAFAHSGGARVAGEDRRSIGLNEAANSGAPPLGAVPLGAIAGICEAGKLRPLPALARKHREAWIRAFRQARTEGYRFALRAREAGGLWYIEGGAAALVALELAHWAGHEAFRPEPGSAPADARRPLAAGAWPARLRRAGSEACPACP